MGNGGRMRRLFLLTLSAVVFCSVFVAGPSRASSPPQTRARSTTVGQGPVTAGFPIDFVGVLWSGEATGGLIRFRSDGRWGEWIALQPDGIEEPGEFASALVAAGDAEAYQVRVPGGAQDARAVAIDSTGGDRSSSVEAAADAATAVTSRASWGADESLMTWAPAYYPAQKLTVHHTATANGDPDPAATVRAIYRYHAVDRGWGDIGYHYLIDESGHVYEGRWSGSDSDAAHNVAGEVVTAAHVSGYNSGNVGIALLGTLTDREPTASARASLEELLRDLTVRHGIDPQGASVYINPVSGATKTLPNISGHRDWEATECPGATFQALLPSIRASVAGDTTPEDAQPPVISGVAAATATTTASITWSTDENASSAVEWRRSGATSSTVTPTDATLTRSHSVRLSNLARKTKYQFRVVSADASGNTATSSWYSFTTKR